jgi:hypothetical protein
MSANCKVFVSFVAAIILFLAGYAPVLADGPPSGRNYPGFVQPDPREEYHRAIFDLCYFYMSYGRRTGKELRRAQDACNVFAEWIEESGWYEQKSPGWQRVVEPGPAWEGGV